MRFARVTAPRLAASERLAAARARASAAAKAPRAALAHTLAAYADNPHDNWAIRATSNAIPGHQVTGITWGDLRQLLQRLQP